MGDVRGVVGLSEVDKTTLTNVLKAGEPKEWQVNCKITAIYETGKNGLIDNGWYGIPIKKIACEVGKPFKIYWKDGGFTVHQVVKSEPDKGDKGFWIKTSTKTWRFDYI